MSFLSFLSRFLILIFVAAMLITVSVNIISARAASHPEIISPLADTQVQTESTTNYLSPGMKVVIDQALEGTRGIYAVYYKNLKTGETYTQHETRNFQSASLYKLWLMAAAYTLIDGGKLDKEERLVKDASELNRIFDIASESAEMTDGAVSMTVEEAIDRSIVVSHNYAALLLTNRVRIATMRDFLKATGMSRSNVGQPPLTTAEDTALFYEKLYKGELVSKTYSKEMLSILKRQQLNDRIPKYLPDSLQVAHKTGEIYTFKHDAGIVFSPYGDYILVVLSESNSPSQAAERIAQVSKAVYDYVSQQ